MFSFRTPKSTLLSFVLIITFTFIHNCFSQVELSLKLGGTIHDVGKNWHINTGDLNDYDKTKLLTNPDSTVIQWPVIDMNRSLKKNASSTIWLAKKIEQDYGADAVFFIPFMKVIGKYKVFLNQDLLFTKGYANSTIKEFKTRQWHAVPLPADYVGKYLLLQIDPHGLSSKHQMGPFIISYTALLLQMFKNEISTLVLGFIFMFAGIATLYVFVRKNQERDYSHFAFSVMLLCFGFLQIVSTGSKQFLLDSPLFWHISASIAFYLAPVSLFAFFDTIYFVGTKKPIKFCWRSLLTFAIIFVLNDLFDFIPFNYAINVYIVLLSIAAIFLLPSLLKALLHGDKNTRLFVVGLILLTFFGIFDILALFQVMKYKSLFQWGVFSFLAVLIILAERKASENHKKLKTYSLELEDKSKELEESQRQLQDYNETLEARVEERTTNIRNKNKQLRKTLNELNDTQAQLIQSEKMASLGSLVAGIAHEINNPVGAINSASDVIRRCVSKIDDQIKTSSSLNDIKGNSKFSKLFRLLGENNNLIITAGERISKIIKSLKNFSRLDEAEFQQADIHEGIDSTLALVYHELKNKVEIIKNYGHLPFVDCFPNELNQVFMNLFVNGAHAIEKKGQLIITTSSNKNTVEIEIKDTGKGIAPENINKIFDPGFTTKGVGVGTGLGLSISYNIIKKHNGKIDVASEVDKGTVFTITLPIKNKSNGKG